jgi:hypothetical protein
LTIRVLLLLVALPSLSLETPSLTVGHRADLAKSNIKINC